MTDTLVLDPAQQQLWEIIARTIPVLQSHRARPQDKPHSDESASGFWGKLFSAAAMETAPSADMPASFYLWGDVGRGKTVLMHRFANALPRAQIVHFHHFMKQIHGYLKQLNHQTEPVFWATREIAKQYDVICLDEFLVSDITDAMILSKVLTFLEQHRVFLFTTSNFAPRELYKNGLQRSQFLSAIAHIENKFQVLHLDHDTDYRYQSEDENVHYFTGAEGQARFQALCERRFGIATEQTIRLQARDIDVLGIDRHPTTNADTLRAGKTALWTTFAALCETARSQLDYLELCEQFEAVYLAQVPIMEEEQRDITRRFMMLIDVLYDQSIDLTISAAAPINQLYTGLHWRFEFDRTESRLQEMTR